MPKTVLITGASGSIGGALATRFAQAGHRVALGCFQHPARAEALCRQLMSEGHSAMVAHGNVGSEAQVDQLFLEVEAQYGPVEILVNNAGSAQQRLFDTLTLAEWEAMLNVHATGTFLCCRRALKRMIPNKSGCIVNMSSIWGQVGASCEVHYSAAKAAVIGLSKALAKEVGPSGIRVNCLAPGAVDTPMMEGFTETEKADFCSGVPLGRLATPDEVAAVAYWLASPDAAFVTGQVVGVNGGMMA